jgi:hypothetical protein
MRFAKPILVAVMGIALAVYAFDCYAMATPEAAMQCCDSMPCSSHGAERSQDCCKTMASSHATFVQPHAVQGAPFAPVLVAVLPAVHEDQGVDSWASIVTAHCHAPPLPDIAASLPLRI